MIFHMPERRGLFLHILAGVLTVQIQQSQSFALPGGQNQRLRPRDFREDDGRGPSRGFLNYDQDVSGFKDFEFSSSIDHQDLEEEFDTSDLWDDLKLILLIGRRRRPINKTKVQPSTLEKSSQRLYKEDRIQNHLSRLAVNRSPTSRRLSKESLHTLAGPPYKDQASQPNVTFNAYEAFPPSYFDEQRSSQQINQRKRSQQRIRQHHPWAHSREDDLLPPIQRIPDFPESNIHKRAPYSLVRAIKSEQTSPTIRKGTLLNKPPHLSNRIARKDKFRGDPAYTFALTDGVHRNYRQLNPQKRSSKSEENRQSSENSFDSQYFLATVGYPSNHWKRIDKKELDYYT